jgi:hypothetical protein
MRRTTGIVTMAVVMLLSGIASAADLPKDLVDPYLQVQVALASDQFTGVAPLAEAIQQAAAPLGSDAEPIVEGAKKLGAATDIAAARTAFGEVSSALAAYAEKTNSGLGPDVRLAFCPMLKKPWLQKGTDIRNPYYGASMLTCGSFKK